MAEYSDGLNSREFTASDLSKTRVRSFSEESRRNEYGPFRSILFWRDAAAPNESGISSSIFSSVRAVENTSSVKRRFSKDVSPSRSRSASPRKPEKNGGEIS